MATTTPNRGYQLPAAGNKLKDDVLRIIAALGAIDADMAATLLALTDKSNVGHGHGMDAITGLVAALGNKLDVGHHDALANLTDVDVAGVANGMALLRQASKWIPVALQINNIAGLETALNSKATPADIAAAINALVGAAPGALDTLSELAEALGDDPNFAATVTATLASINASLAARVGYGAQTKTATEQGQARANIGAGVMAGHRNKVRNPRFLVNQRGLASAAAGVMSDGWEATTFGAGATGTLQSVSERNSVAYQFGRRNLLAWERTAGTSFAQMRQKIEGVETLAGKKATLAVLGYTSGANLTLQAGILQNFGTGGSPNADTTGLATTPLTFTAAPSIQYVVFDMPPITGRTLGSNNNDHLNLFFNSPAAGAFGMRFLDVALVEGDASAEIIAGNFDFAPRPIAVERTICRYYLRTMIVSVEGYAGGPNDMTWPIQIDSFRAAPSVSYGSPSQVGNVNNSGVTMRQDGSGFYLIRANASGNTYVYGLPVTLNAEL